MFSDRELKPDGWTYLDAFFSFPSFVGVLVFAYRRNIFFAWFWRCYAPFIFVWNFWIEGQRQTSFDSYFWMHFAFLVPMYYGLAKLGFDKSLWPDKKE